jgi:hypothetical protein
MAKTATLSAEPRQTKKCSSCKKRKNISQVAYDSKFYKNRNTPDGFAYWCKDCDTAAKKGRNVESLPPDPIEPLKIEEAAEPMTPIAEVLPSVVPTLPRLTNEEAIRFLLFEAKQDRAELRHLRADMTLKDTSIGHLSNEIKRLNVELDDKQVPTFDPQLVEQVRELQLKLEKAEQERADAKELEIVALKDNHELNGKVAALQQTLDLREMRIKELEGHDNALVSPGTQGELNALFAERGAAR